MPGPSSTKRSTQLDENLLNRLDSAGFTIDRSLFSGVNPTLQVIYKCWIAGNNLMSEVETMVNNREWPRELGKSPNQTEIIGLFIAKTTWHYSYVKLIPHALAYPDMKAWLEEDPDSISDLELWGFAPRGRYTMTQLENWLDEEDKKKDEEEMEKSTKKPAAKKVKVTKAVEKKQTKESQVASGSGKGK
jgi:hypothetical protein